MSDNTATLGKVFVGIFIFEIIGAIFAITFGNVSTGSNTGISGAISGFNTFTSLVNDTTTNIVTSFSGCSFATLSCSKPIPQLTPTSSSWFLSGVANAIIWLVDVLVTIVNVILNFIWLIINLIALIMLMLGLFGFVFVVFIPLIMVSVGPIGDLLALGYALLIGILGFKYGHVILEMIGTLMGFVSRFI